MDIRPLTLCLAAAFLAVCHSCSTGKEFITTFLTNYQDGTTDHKLYLVLTAQESEAKVQIKVASVEFFMELTLSAGETQWVSLPPEAELEKQLVNKGSAVRILSSTPISVVSFNRRTNTGDGSVVSPIDHLGTDHIIYTPNDEKFDKLIGIVNGNSQNKITIIPAKDVQLRNEVNWMKGEAVTFTLEPYDTFLVRGLTCLTSTRIQSEKPVAVLAGHQCLNLGARCEHVYEQLPPVAKMGKEYVVPPTGGSEAVNNVVIVTSEDKTSLTMAWDSGSSEKFIETAGVSLLQQLPHKNLMVVKSDKNVMVLLLSSNKPHDPFLITLIPNCKLSTDWGVEIIGGFTNTIAIVAETQIDRVDVSVCTEGKCISVPPPTWYKSGSEWVWSNMEMRTEQAHVIVRGDARMAVYAYGGEHRNGYGIAGVCIPGDPCKDIMCRQGTKCANGECVPTSTATCRAVGDPHYRTFDGRRYDFQGTCTYIMATVTKQAPDLTPFTVTTKNDHRGNQRVSYVRKVTVTVKEVKITIGRHKGRVEMNGELLYLPLFLAEKGIKVEMRGGSAVLSTDFGLVVSYNWISRLYITVPSSYFEHVGGLCGDYNGDKKDDLPDPTDNSIPVVLEMIKKWKADDSDLFCTDNCGGSCPRCPLEQQEHFRKPEQCGLITKEDGPFAACHQTVSPFEYLGDCVYDVCSNKGAKPFLCDNMETYFGACLLQNVSLGAQWREQSGCILPCPAGSHYKACGTACPASCSALNSEELCEQLCVEGCQCDEGLVLSGDRCVPQSQCGCQYQGKYYPAGTKFWGDNTCTSRCECINGKAECKDVRCKESEQCAVKKGIRDCYPTSYGSCKCTGDPHCTTLDNKRFDFQGACTYVLAQLKPGSNQGLEPFQVLVSNENRGRNKRVSYTKSTSLIVFGNFNVSMSRTQPGKIWVNSQVVNLPYTSEDGKLTVHKKGRFAVVRVSFGLKLYFNWRAYVKVTLPSSYSGETVGLCGNFNGNKDDDFLKSDGTQTNNVNEFGVSWKVGEDLPGGCGSDCPGDKCPKCEPALLQQYQQKHYCGIISDEEGPFSQCHSKLDHTDVLKDCTFDLCMYQGHTSALCNSLSAFSTDCQQAGAMVESWRRRDFCPLPCPANSHYEVCARPCQLICGSLTTPESCDEDAPCVEDCVCDDGFVLSNQKCVPLAECGCLDGGQYYENGQVFFTGQSCETRCVCSDGGQIQCVSNFKCSEHEECALKDGSLSCQPKSFGYCSVCGAGALRSFDGQKYLLHGNCLFTLSEVEAKDGGKPAYSVTLQQEAGEVGSVSRNVEITVYGIKITMETGKKGQVKVDNIILLLPASLEGGKVRVYPSGNHIIVETDFDVKLIYDTVGSVILQIPSTYHSAPKGLCGNFNNNPADDLVNGDPLATATAWLVQNENVQCEVGCGAAPCPGPDADKVPEAQQACDIIQNTQGPFEGCHSTVNAAEHYNTCVNELATHPGNNKLLCEHIQKYVTVCQIKGAKIKEWRSDKFCPLTCPSGSHYELCTSTLSSTCSSLQDSADPPACQEGCQCDGNMLFDGTECVSLEKCGCYVNGRYYRSGTSVLSKDCSKICSCESGELSCDANSCQEGEECLNRDGTISCIRKDPCEGITCRQGTKCVNGECVHTSTAICKAVGDPHYFTFDRRRYDFQGTCTYIMATVTKQAPDLTPFTVTTKNDHRGNQRVSYVRKVTVTVKGVKITIGRHRGRVEMNGELLYLPLFLAEKGIKVEMRGGSAVLSTDFGLVVSYNWISRLYITVPSSYFEHVGGLCGDYNGDKKDDLPDPTDNSIPVVLEMIKKWKADDSDLFCTDNCGGSCPHCPLEQQEHFRKPEQCGLITKEDGPFAACHQTVSPFEYLGNCVYDVCSNKGGKQFLCDNMETYFGACLLQNVSLGAQWREQSDCILPCPAGSHYKACGTACPASCSALNSEELCEQLCVEGCQCDEGLVLSGDRCVPQSQCGCQYQGKYYPAGTKFWGDNTCTSRCECINGKAECKDVRCKESEQCAVKKGIRDCYPTSYGSCKCTGDPHCTTLDNKRFDFQGACTYVLAQLKPGSNQGLEPFQVLVSNENRGRNKRVSYTKSTSLIVFGNFNVSMSRTQPGKIWVNSQVVNLPYTSEDGKLTVHKKGRFAVVRVSFGLKLYFNWRAYVKVTLPSSYSGETVGLCGNFNGNKDDDFLKSDGTQTNNVNEFGVSWKVGEDLPGGCGSDCPGDKCPKCEPALLQQYQQKHYCGIISDEEGPFSQCHSKLDHTDVLKDCTFDLCMYQGHTSALCNSLSAFSTDCQQAGAMVESWRRRDFCPLPCPANSHYEVCARPCQLICGSLTTPESCDEDAPCVEDCVCDDGFVLSNQKCVPLAECGCLDGGQYYENGQVFFTGQSCETRCVCSDGGQIQCVSNFKCSEHEECALKDGSLSCQPKSFGYCSVCGAGALRSFDGQKYLLHGNCLFTLSEVEAKDGGKPAYSVTLQQEAGEVGSVSRNVEITVYGIKITMETGKKGQVKVDNIILLLPASLEGGKVRVYPSGNHIIVETDFDVKLIYDTVGSVVLQIPSTYHSAPKGLCGNFNNNPADDLVNGDPLATATAWLVQNENVQCEVGCGAAPCPGPDADKVPEAQQACDIIQNTQGPFEGCHSTVNAAEHYNTCVNELATHPGNNKLLCEHIQKYVTVCQIKGAKIKEWRSDKFCPLTCPSGSHYELCTSTLSSTCSSLQDSADPPACQEGCQCDGNMLFDGTECVSFETCGCYVNGRYYRSGTSVLSKDCSKICSCESGELSCDANSCQEGEECLNRDGTISCIRKDPCEGITCRQGTKCVNGECVHTSTAICKAVGDPHYVTFDGRRYDFQGTCTYIMATVTKQAPDLTPFTVTTKNDHRGSQRVSYVRKVTVTVKGVKITIGRHRGQVEMNGELLYLPLFLTEKGIKVEMRGGSAVLSTDFGLVVSYNWISRLYITVPSSYFEHVGGLCGDYNGDKKDDLPDPTDNSIPVVLEMIKKWKADDSDLFCTDNCGGSCPHCPLEQQEHFSKPEQCGLITKEDGPFAACHQTVSPFEYLDDCVYDVCSNKGAKQFLCDNMETYFRACLLQNVSLGAQWREQSGCILPCPAGSHYKACGTACPASCSALNSEELCEQLCVEGCQCDEGLVLSGDRCVPQSQCGCQYQGKYYPAGTKFWGDNTCTSRCECINGKAECKDVRCKESEQCAVKKGIRDCYPTSYGSCKCTGDPHCTTLDNKRFDFQGACTYVLAQLKPGSNQGLEPFQVLVSNENRGRNKRVSYTKSTSLIVFGNFNVSMSRTQPGKIWVNSQVVNLPYTSEDGKLTVHKKGRFAVVRVSFGLKLFFNWRAYVKVTLPSSYSGETVGLCGNFNGNKDDDFLKSDGTQTNNVNEFGVSWKVGEDLPGGCGSDCPGDKCPKCEPALLQQYQQKHYCGIISDEEGPFSQCHSKLDHTDVLKDCTFDLCMYQGHTSALCNSLSAFSTDCQQAGAMVESWRRRDFCPLPCPANSHYEVCARPCQLICGSLTTPESCDEDAPCVEDCVCDDGFVLSNQKCVPLAECGCLDGGQYYENGQVFFTGQSCETRCVCSDGGQIQCVSNFKCSEHEECALKDGSLSCQPKSFGYCSVCGAGALRSFDGQNYLLHGNCLFTLSEVEAKDGGKPAYSVTLQQEAGEVGSVSRNVEITVYGIKITMETGKKGQVKVDNIILLLPASLEGGKVRVYPSGNHIIVETDFDVKLIYDTVGSVVLQIPSTYHSAPKGLCGNFNNNPADDLVNGDPLATATAWLVQNENVQCEVGCGAAPCPGPDADKVPEAQQACDIIQNTQGPFEGCHSTVNAAEHYNTCVNELATHPGNNKLLCEHIQKYVTVCQIKGAKIKEWRSDKFCPLTCPSGSHYELCTSTLSSTCSSLQDSADPPACQEGCQCDGNMLFDGTECVSFETCGCYVNGRYYRSGTSVLSKDCSKICSCESGELSCDANSCQEGEECLNRDGTISCIRKDPCEGITCRQGTKCVNGECVHTSTAICKAVGDPHYVTFDGRRYDFQGTCTYIMATVTKQAPDLTPFTVTTKNDHRGSQRVSYVRKVTVTVKEVKITIGRHRGRVEMNGELLYLPLFLTEKGIKVEMRGGSAVLSTDFGLVVSYNWISRLYITVPSSYFEHVGGLCGDYNGDKKDDLPDPTDNSIPVMLEMIKKWKADDSDLFCTDNCGGSCPHCPLEQQEHFSKPEQCGLITKEDGPFAACHQTVSPFEYLDDCVYDVCSNKGAKQFLCDNMETYFGACLLQNVSLGAQWREQSGCILPCPAGSHYKACGTACPASCSALNSEELCEQLCVEGCQCDEGLVLSGDRCVPQSQCGCQYQGKYYPAGTKFWGDNTCTTRCECINGKAECKDVRCKESEQCAVKKGIRDCYPTSYGSCKCTGDPHCTTLDNKRFDFQGACTYVLAQLKPGSNQGLEPFQVLVSNENRGRNKRVSYTKSTSLIVFGNFNVSMSRTQPGKIWVNSQVVNLPYTSEDGKLTVHKKGRFAVVRVSFGLKLFFNWRAYVKVTLPSSYSGETVGLCGNFNGNKDDDFLKSDGTQTNNVNEFGVSWKVGEDLPGGCGSDCPGDKCPKCEPALLQQYQQKHYCGIISDEEGPFSQCHSKLDHTDVLKDCTFDLCMYQGHTSALCNSLSAFSTDCQQAGAMVESWRRRDFCPLPCPANSHYEVCARPCQLICGSLTTPESCDEDAPCVEDCVCDDGFVLSNQKCVPLAECGCLDGGQYYENGQVFFTGQSCETRCVCSDGGQIQCVSNFKCSEHEECALKDGSLSCQPKSFGYCSVCGAGALRSFDGQNYLLHGNCLFTLSEVEAKDGGKPAYSVTLQQEAGEVGSVSRNVEITVYDIKITMETGKKGQVKVDNIILLLPASLEGGKVRVYPSGNHIIVETDFDVKLIYDTVGSVVLQIPSTYHSAPKGLCGNFNNNPADDLVNGDPLATATAWLVQNENVQCEVGCGAAPCPGPDADKVPEAQQACDIIQNTQGPFEGCHSTVNAAEHYNTCVNELATHPGNNKLLCEHIQKYVTVCQIKGAKIKEWRSDKFCPLTCPSGSHYELCTSTLSSTCSSLQDSADPPACQEGCQCDGNMLFDGAECVSLEKCGCSVNGRYYKSGTSVFAEDCSELCSCESGKWNCEANSCKDEEECRNKDGTIGCFPIDPCADLECRLKEHCEISEGQGVCVPDSKALCWAFGDPHFTTFDGMSYSFQGTCSYVFLNTTGLDSFLPDVSVIMKGELRGNSEGSFVGLVTVKMLGHTITIVSGDEDLILLDDVIVDLPVYPSEGRISITQTGIRGTIMTDIGIELTFDWSALLMITISSSYFGNVRGLCGNFNGDRSDDMTTAEGNVAADVTAWASSWSVPDGDPFCFHHCEGECPQCSDEDRKTFTGPDYCGILSNKTGPFASCHMSVPVQKFVEDCLYDVCINEGRQEVLCEALSNYLVECQEVSAEVDEWRELAGCPLQCPQNSHYNLCGTGCPPTCGRQPDMCPLVCVEGCFCDDGYVLSGKECVIRETGCGCDHDGRYYKPDEEFWADSRCKEKCICDPVTQKVQCNPAGCGAREICSIVDGVQDCYPMTFEICTARGDPHFLTFDERKFSFQGNCVYRLASLCKPSKDLKNFEITLENENRKNKRVSYAKAVALKVFNKEFTLSRENIGKVLVDGLEKTLPFNWKKGQVHVYGRNRRVVIETHFLKLSYDFTSSVKLELASIYEGATCGLCGNMNGDPSDDLMLPNGEQAASANDFGVSQWVSDAQGCSQECKNCPPAMPPGITLPFTKDCDIIINKEGPLAQCINLLVSKNYFDDCVFDMMLTNGDVEAACEIITDYVDECQFAGGDVKEWRTKKFCPMKCPPKSEYSLKAPGCPITCASPSPPANCKIPPSEGCVCKKGLLKSKDGCVKLAKCGCKYDGQYLEPGEGLYVDSECSSYCKCNRGKLVCTKKTCKKNEKCAVIKGVMDCYDRKMVEENSYSRENSGSKEDKSKEDKSKSKSMEDKSKEDKSKSKSKEDKSKEDKSKEDKSMEDKSMEDKSMEDKSKEDKSKEDKSKEDKSKEDKSKEDKSKEDKSKEDKSKEDKSKEDKSKEDKSKEDKSKEDKSKEDKSMEDKSKSKSMEDKSKEDKSKEDKSMEDKSMENKSKEDKSKSKSMEDKSMEDKSKEDKSKEDKSMEDKSMEDKSMENKSMENKSKEDKSKEDKSMENKSKEDKSKSKSMEDKSMEDKSMEDKSKEDKSMEDKSMEDKSKSKSMEDKSMEDKSMEDKSMEDKSMEDKSMEDKSMEDKSKSKSMEDKSMEDKSMEDKSMEDKSMEDKSKSKSMEDKSMENKSKSKSMEDKSMEDKSMENKSMENKSMENKSKEDKSKSKSMEDKSMEDKSMEDKSKEDKSKSKSKEDKSKEDKSKSKSKEDKSKEDKSKSKSMEDKSKEDERGREKEKQQGKKKKRIYK